MENELDRQPFDYDPDYISKSEFKRESDAAQKLGCSLIALSDKQLNDLELDEQLYDAIKLIQIIKPTSEGYRRQMQLIGKLTRGCAEDIKDKIALLNKTKNYDYIKFQIDKLIKDLFENTDITIQNIIEENSSINRQQLRQMVKKAQKTDNIRELTSYLHKELFS